MFHRAEVSLNGELTWFTKNRFGRKKQHHSFVRTENLSLDGTKIEIPGLHQFPIDHVARVRLGITYCDVRVMAVEHRHDSTIVRLVFVSPNTDLISFLEQSLPVGTTNRQFYEGKWT